MSFRLQFNNASIPHPIIGLCLVLAAALSLAMALSSRSDAHPDEAHHLSAALYYREHFVPPVIGDPKVRESYSVWGVSYLNYHWAEYFYAGKFAGLTAPLVGDARLAARFANISLLAALAALGIFAIRRGSEAAMAPCMLVVSPQIWYVFSYSNNDAFALTVATLLAYLLIAGGGVVEKYIREDRLVYGAVFGVLTGLLAVCKPNYWTFLLFAAGWMMIEARPLNARVVKKLAAVAVIAASVVAFRVGLDLYVNGETNFAGASYVSYFLGGFETQQTKLMRYQDEIAEYPFKPSTLEHDLAGSRAEVKLRAKGVTAWQMFTVWRFHVYSFCSFVGVYGYLTIWGRGWYYAVMALLYTAMGIYLAVKLIRGRDRGSVARMVLFAACAFVAIAGSFYLSWNYAFQPQGRYLFPIVPMAAVTIAAERSRFDGRIVNALLAAMFVLSAYSFVVFGLKNINQP
ncbi:MAG: hypothetical protein ACK4S4_13295 [Pyrinomonadaceae bacterium]